MRWIIASVAVSALLVLQLTEAKPHRPLHRSERSPQFGIEGLAVEFPGEVAQRPGSRPPRPRPTTSPTNSPATSSAPAPAPTTAVASCNCPSTPEFNPVCGTNNMTYDNPGKLNCARLCGTRVDVSHYGQCPATTTAAPAA